MVPMGDIGDLFKKEFCRVKVLLCFENHFGSGGLLRVSPLDFNLNSSLTKLNPHLGNKQSFTATGDH